MRTKEREYLLQAANILSDFTEFDKFASTIYELLAQPEQPEQTEQEPVAWKTEKKSYLDEIDRLSMEANKDQEEIDRLTQWLTQPERKPLTDEDICEILIKKEWKGFVDLVRIIEKAHGITGGEE